MNYLSNVPDDLICCCISHRVVEAGNPNPKSVKAIVGPIDGQHRCPGIGLGHATVPLQNNDLSPDLVIN